MNRELKKKVTLVFQIIILVALGISIRQLYLQDQRHDQQNILLDPKDADHLVIQREGEVLEFAKEQDHWQMLKPQNAPANAQRVTPILSLLRLPTSQRYALADVNAAELGFAPPRATVVINELEFQFGGADPSSNRRYLLIGEDVYLIDDLIFPLISSPADSFLPQS